MNKWKDYHSVTENKPPRENMIRFMEKYKITGNTIDLGCGSGCDTIYLIKHNLEVLAIDSTDVENIIRNKLNAEEQEKLNFQVQRFENLNLPTCNLVVSNNALPFCIKEYFYDMWKKISNCINLNGFFVGNFFGLKDEWNTPKDKRTFLSREEVIELFKDFDILEFEEIQKDRPTALGKMKHWHTYEIVARKK